MEDDIFKNVTRLMETLVAVTLPLVVLDDRREFPKRRASGFIVPRAGRNFLLTAAHAIASDNWFMEWDPLRDGVTPALLLPLGKRWVVHSSIDVGTGAVNKVDLAWAEVDFGSAVRQAAADARLAGKNLTLPPAYLGPLDLRPNRASAFAYVAHNRVQGERHPGVLILERSPSMEYGMELVGEDDATGVLRFRPADGHQGHPYYEGASGSPIADEEGHIVGVLLRGDTNSDELIGISLARYDHLIGANI